MEGKPGSHMKVWKPITYDLIRRIAREHEGVVYILWGEFAKKLVDDVGIDINKNLVLTSRHPSPLAASKGPFVGNMHFTKANEYLVTRGKEPIKWV
jgi:uracil-DNA glycosylase